MPDHPFTDTTVTILGVGVRAQNIDRAVTVIAQWIERRARTYVCVANVHSVVECERQPELKKVLNAAGMVTTDGMPLVWLCRAAGHPHAERVYGPDLMLAVCAQSVEHGWRHFLYGGSEAVLSSLKANLESWYPGLAVVDAHAPPHRPPTDAEDAAIVARINASQADIVWVGLGAPKQEYWMADHRDKLTASVLIGVGAAFDFHAGAKPQAPPWMRRRGLEWLFRMATEPRRLWRRYLITNTLFIVHLMLRGLKRRPKREREDI